MPIMTISELFKLPAFIDKVKASPIKETVKMSICDPEIEHKLNNLYAKSFTHYGLIMCEFMKENDITLRFLESKE